MGVVLEGPEVGIGGRIGTEGIGEELLVRDGDLPAAGFHGLLQRGDGLRVGLVIFKDDGDLFIGDSIGQLGDLGGGFCCFGGDEIGGVNFKAEGCAEVIEGIVAGNQHAGLGGGEFLFGLVMGGGDLAFIVIGGRGVVRGVLGVDIAKLLADALDGLASQLGAIPDMRIEELLAALSLIWPG